MSYEKIKDSISPFHDDGICLASRTIKMFGPIDPDMMEKTISNLHLLDQNPSPVTILLNTTGGNVSDGLAIIDAIRAMNSPVRIIAYGGVESMGAVIFQAADEDSRFMMPNSYLMFHEGESGIIDRKSNKKDWEKLENYQDDQCDKICLARIKKKKKRFTMEQLKEKMKVDWILLPEEAIEWGLADEILEVY